MVEQEALVVVVGVVMMVVVVMVFKAKPGRSSQSAAGQLRP